MPTYSDAEMKAIMGRALQIDSGRSERFTPEQLRTIATELNISTQALEVAMYEADSKGVAPNFGPTYAPAPRNGWAKGVAIAVGLLVVAALGLGFMRMTVRGRDVPRITARPAGEAVAARPTRKTAPAEPTIAPPETPTPVAKTASKKPASPQ
jgi:hypothetical protein